MKEKKTRTECLGGLSIIEFIVIKLCPFEKPFHKLVLRVLLGFPNTQKQYNH